MIIIKMSLNMLHKPTTEWFIVIQPRHRVKVRQIEAGVDSPLQSEFAAVVGGERGWGGRLGRLASS